MKTTLQNIFNDHYGEYRRKHGVSLDQHKAAKAIMECQSEKMGHEEWTCPHDGYVEYKYHSCRNRSCPRCNGAQTHDWLERIQERLLPCDHYHVIFTLPHELNVLWQYNRKWCSDKLLKASAETIQQLLADERYLGAQVGMISSLHTWGRTLSFHPHVHVLVSGGGVARDGWRSVQKEFLLPVGVIKAKFKGKWLSWLNRAYAQGEIVLPPHWSESVWLGILHRIAKKTWNIRIQGGYKHGRGVSNYLSRYVRGGPIKDRRLVHSDEQNVSFRYHDHHDGKEKIMTLASDDFIGRVLWHVPCKGQHNVRYYGLYVPGARMKRDLVRLTLGVQEEREPTQSELIERHCPHCGKPLVHRGSVPRKNSYIRQGRVQQHVQVDRGSTPPPEWRNTERPMQDFLWPHSGHLTER